MPPVSLSGFTAAVTADRRRDEQATILSRLGLEVRLFPLLRTEPEDEAALLAVTRDLVGQPPDYLVANTGYGMRSWLAQARVWGLAEDMASSLGAHSRIAARGAKALGELRKVGLDAWYKAPGETLDEVVDRLLDEGIAGCTVLVQLHGEPSDAVVARLQAAGASVTSAQVYKMGAGAHEAAAGLITAVLEGGVDVVTFTAAPQVQAMAEVAENGGQIASLLSCFNPGGVIAACIGPVCAAAASDVGIVAPLVPEHARLGSLGTSIGLALQAQQVGLGTSHGVLSLSGAELAGPQGPLVLRPAQRRVLRSLVTAQGRWVDLAQISSSAGPGDLAPLTGTLGGALQFDGPRARLALI